jgi:hypothetical protein
VVGTRHSFNVGGAFGLAEDECLRAVRRRVRRGQRTGAQAGALFWRWRA